MSELQLSDGNFDGEVVKSDRPVLVDFWAPWCGPCRMLAPLVEELSKEYDGKVKVGKLNTDDNTQVATRYRISMLSLPCSSSKAGKSLTNSSESTRNRRSKSAWTRCWSGKNAQCGHRRRGRLFDGRVRQTPYDLHASPRL